MFKKDRLILIKDIIHFYREDFLRNPEKIEAAVMEGFGGIDEMTDQELIDEWNLIQTIRTKTKGEK